MAGFATLSRAPKIASDTELVATLQNLGHIDVQATLRSQGQIDGDQMRDLIAGESGGYVLE